MTAECEICGRPAENGTPTHWLGCREVLRQHARNLVEPDFTGSLCEHDGCSNPKKEWSGKGAKPKYCADGHKQKEKDMSDGFAGDPMHEGGSQPMASLKGGMESPNTQMPMQGENSGDTGGNTVTPNIAGWNTTSLQGGHPTTGSNDSQKAH